MLITPLTQQPADRPARKQRTTGKLAQQAQQQARAVDQPPTVPAGLGLAKLTMNSRLSLNAKVSL